MKTLWCILTFRHRGRISHDERGVFWECSHCHHRAYVEWADIEWADIPQSHTVNLRSVDENVEVEPYHPPKGQS